MRTLFVNDHGQIRSGWRVICFLFVFLFLATALRILEETVVSGIPIDRDSTTLLFLTINSVGLVILSLGVGAVAGKLFENLPFQAIGASFTKTWFRHLVTGIVIGAATLILAVFITFLLNGEKFQINPVDDSASIFRSLVISFIVFAAGAAWEEAFFRGYMLQTFSRSGLGWFAVLITSLFFGLVHLGNDDATLLSTVNTVIAGIWFSLAYFKTRDLWLVWGLHLIWNWTQGSVFGIEVSGMIFVTTSPLLKEIDSGPAWLTGGSYGIEGGVACTIALVISIGLIYFLTNLNPPES